MGRSSLRFFVPTVACAAIACSGARSSELFSECSAGSICTAHEETVTVEPAQPGDVEGARLPPSTPPGPGSDPGTGTGNDPTAFETFGKCDRDVECDRAAGQVCNWKLDLCATRGPVGTPCSRDEECSTKLCNWQLDECALPAPLGEPCKRDDECASKLCNWKLDACALMGAPGDPCGKDHDCASLVCNMQTDECK